MRSHFPWFRVANAILFSLLTFASSGCSTFNREWKTAIASPIPTDDLQGPWEGSWLSQVNGHQGRLRCLVLPVGEGKYQARFHANYRKVLSFGYTVVLEVRRTNGLFKFHGEADLGWLAGGRYHYEGQATPTNFVSAYHSKYDHGTFQMTRPK